MYIIRQDVWCVLIARALNIQKQTQTYVYKTHTVISALAITNILLSDYKIPVMNNIIRFTECFQYASQICNQPLKIRA